SFRRNKFSAKFFYFLIQELASVDMLILLPSLVEDITENDALYQDEFAAIILSLSAQGEESALARANTFDQHHKHKIHAELLEFILRSNTGTSGLPPDVLTANFPLLRFIHVIIRVLNDDFTVLDINQIDEILADELIDKEVRIMAHVLQLHLSIIENNTDALVQNVASLMQLTGFEEGPALEDIEDLKRIWVGLIRKADQSLCADAGDLAVKIGENFFSDDPIFMSFKYRRDILRSKRRGPYSSAIRLYFKYLFLPQMQWLTSSASKRSGSKKTEVFNSLIGD
ncbi:MAG: hypothetical protein DWQ10_03235, partial [Calditrichaeota bacterium]